MAKTAKDIIELIKANDIKMVDFKMVDIHGQYRHVTIPANHFNEDLLKEGIGNRVIAMQHDEIVDFDIFEALNMKKSLDLNMYKIAHEISI